MVTVAIKHFSVDFELLLDLDFSELNILSAANV